MKEENGTGIAAELKAPRAGAVAGILFSVLLFVSLVLTRLAVPYSPGDPGTWLSESAKSIRLALGLLPFAGIAFLWFMGVLRDRMGTHEDRFLATVFLGSGVLFLAMTFASSAVVGGLLMAYEESPQKVMDSGTYTFARTLTYVLVNVYALRMAGVFMFLHLHARDSHRNVPALDGVAGLHSGAFSAPEHRTLRLGYCWFFRCGRWWLACTFSSQIFAPRRRERAACPGLLSPSPSLPDSSHWMASFA